MGKSAATGASASVAQESPIPSAAASGSAATSAVAPRLAKVTLRITPAGASVFLDGEPVTPAADGTIERPTGESHRLRVEAAGFTTDERTLAFEADRAVDVRLVRGKGIAKPAASVHPSSGQAVKPPTDPSDVLGY